MADNWPGANKVIIQRLEPWTEDFRIDPQDWSLGLSADVNYKDVDPRIFEIWKRFYDIGFLQDFGHQCILISALLRRILKMHGINARTEEIITKYSHDGRQWNQIIGIPEQITHAGNVDTHRVVVSNGLILDWAHRDSIHRMFGAMSPRGFIGDYNKLDKVQELGFFGQVKWKQRETHPGTLNIDYYIREDVLHLTRMYFERYLMR